MKKGELLYVVSNFFTDHIDVDLKINIEEFL